MEEQKTKKQFFKEADLLQLFAKLIAKWKLILGITVCFILFGLAVVLFRVKVYTSEITVAPKKPGQSALNNMVNLYSNLFGASLNISSNEDLISPSLYPDIIRSLPFLASIFNVNVQTLDGSVNTTYYNYLTKYSDKPSVDITKIMPDAISRVFSSSDEEADTLVFDPYRLSRKQLAMIESLSGSINVIIDKKTNVVTLSFTDPDPMVAAIITDTIMSRVQQVIIDSRTEKIRQEYINIEKIYKKTKEEYEQAQERYAEYMDEHRNKAMPERFYVEKEKLESDKELKNTLYTQWAQQLALLEARIQEQTPVFVTIKPAFIPATSSSMSGVLILILYAFAGVFVSVAYLLLKDNLVKICSKIFKYKKE